MTEAPSYPLIEGFKDGVTPPPLLPLRDWVSENVYLPNSPEGARYSVEAIPAHGFIFDALADSDVKEISLLACVGFGKTALLEAWMTSIVSIHPGDTLVVGQSGEMIKDWMESRMRKVWLSSPLSSPYIPRGPERSNWKKDSVIFRHMNFFAGAANETDLQEKSMVNTAGDECWRWKYGMIDFLLKRHHGRWNRKNLLMSQGGVEGTEWHTHAEQGKWFDMEHQCPSCKEWSVFDWKMFRKYEKIKDNNDELDWPAIYKTVRLTCPKCDEDFKDEEYNRRQWSKCRPIWNGAKHIPERVTFSCSFLTVWRYQWRDIVKEWILANDERKEGQYEKLQNVINQRFAQFWKPPTTTPKLAVQGDPYKLKEYHEGQKWDGETMRFLRVDVQQGHSWATVRTYQIGGASRLLWAGRLETWENVRYIQEQFGIENRFVFVDCGYDQERVAMHALKAIKDDDPNPWNLLKGEDTEGYMTQLRNKRYMRIFSDYTHVTASNGKPYKIIRFSNLKAKNKLAALMEQEGFGIPGDITPAYHKQMQSEQKREVAPGKWRWVPIKKGYPNHLWDTEVMGVVAACIFGIFQGLEEVKK